MESRHLAFLLLTLSLLVSFEEVERQITEGCGFESNLGLGFFPEFHLMQKTYYLPLLLLLLELLLALI